MALSSWAKPRACGFSGEGYALKHQRQPCLLLVRMSEVRSSPKALPFIAEGAAIHIRIPLAASLKTMPNSKASRVVAKYFQATLERMRSRLNWTVVHIPFEVAKLWGSRGQFRVKGEINGFAFRTSLFPTGQGGHILLVNKRMQKGARAVVGTVARFHLEPDSERHVVTVPPELNRILAQDRALRRWYGQLNHSTRNDIAKWVSDPKGPEARLRRAEQIAERLMATVDAERELPPILQVAFARNPLAWEGWDRMSKAKRRAHLLGIFGYRNPESRARRIDKMLDEASTIAHRIGDRR
jgi:Domain of unknown function (DUF1905)/Bacteriocin-protection, YdeI or OmpD-Associated